MFKLSLMNGRLLNVENDIELDPVTNQVRRAASLRDKVKRQIRTVLGTFQGECFVDYDAGVPWFGDILGNSVLFADEVNAEIKDKILEIADVVSVEDIMVRVDGRNISGKYKVRISDNEIIQDDF